MFDKIPGGLPGTIGFMSGIVIMTGFCFFYVGRNAAKHNSGYGLHVSSTQEERQPMHIPSPSPMEASILSGSLRRPTGRDAMIEGNALTIGRPHGDLSV